MDLCCNANGKELNVESPHFIIEEIGKIKLISESVLARILNYRSEVSVLTFEIIKLNSIIDELRDENERLKREAKGGEA